MNFFEILSDGFCSVLGGLFTALIIAGGLLYMFTVNSRKGLNPIALICCAILFCLLFYQTTLMYAAIGSKHVAMDFITACHLQFGENIDGAELKEQMVILIRENPLISFFIDYTDLEDFDWSQPIKSLRSVVAREYNWFIFRRVIWSVVFTTLSALIVALTSHSGKKRRRLRRPYSSDNDIFNFD